MKDFWRLVIQDEFFAVRQPAIEANNFELKLALITMVQQHQYTRNPSEDSNEHMRRILRMENTVKLNGVRCHTPIPGPTRLADPNRVRGARPYTWDSLPVFFKKKIQNQNIIYISKELPPEWCPSKSMHIY